MIRRSDEGGIILSDDEQRAVVAYLICNAIERSIEHGWENHVPEMAEGVWDSVADDMGCRADAYLTDAHSTAEAAGFDLEDLMTALTEPEVTP